jgi:hypothetical protein
MVAATSMNITIVVKDVNADKNKYYCSNDPVVPFCTFGPNRAFKQNVCEPLDLNCHNTRQTCQLIAGGKCAKVE